MSTPTIFGKTPFLRLLLPVIAGIAAASCLPCKPYWTFLISFVGLLAMGCSFFVKKKWEYSFRWLFGAGLSVYLFALAVLQYQEQDKSVQANFPGKEEHYVATLLDIPEAKPRSVACHLQITHPVDKQVILYLQKTDQAFTLAPGDELVFRARLQSFRNFGNPDDFDYERFMKNKGISGSAYVPALNWQKTGRQHTTLSILSQRFRAKTLNFYQSFKLEPDALAFISAITLGYKAYLSDDLQEAFRASGTAHVLAVSGLHVGIIYAVINFLFSFLGKQGKPFKIRQCLVIATLWAYALIAGMSAPIIRATFMLTIYCVGKIRRQAGFTYNTLAATAFLILLYKPFSLFDVSFLMSFMAVFAILFFQPKIRSIYKPNNAIFSYIWNLSTISLAAQLGVFPLVLYFFGSFPTYFFIANLLVVPLLSLIIYAAVPLIITSLLSPLQFVLISWLKLFFHRVLKSLIELVLRVVYFTETLPFAQITDAYVSFAQLLFLFLFIYLFARFLVNRHARPLLIALASLLSFFISSINEQLTKDPAQWVVFNSPSAREIAVFSDKRRHFVEIPSNGLLPHPERSILILSDDSLGQYTADEPFLIDILILSQNRRFEIEQLSNLFMPGVIVLDSSIPRYTALRLQSECRDLGIPLHDVALHGAYSIFF